MIEVPRTRWLVILGLLLFTFGGIVPIQFSIWSDSNTYEIGPWDSSRESVDIPLNLIYGESAVVDVIFEQSAVADANAIQVGAQEFDGRKIREAASISVQKRVDFLSAEYQAITNALPMDDTDRQLVRAGKFKELERRKNGAHLAEAA